MNHFDPFSKWKDLKKLKEDFPDFSSFETYMQNLFSETMPAAFFPDIFKRKEKLEDYQVFHLHDYVIVRIPIKENVKLKEMKVYHTSSELILEGFPKQGETQTIQLPALVQHKKSKAIYKQQTLEISMPKVQDYRITHLDIRTK